MQETNSINLNRFFFNRLNWRAKVVAISFSLMLMCGCQTVREVSHAVTSSVDHAINAVSGKPAKPAACAVSGKGRLKNSGDDYLTWCDDFPRSRCQQKEDLWCWAAGIQMIYKYRGVEITQEEIVKRVHERASGDDVNSTPVRAALQWEVMVALRPDDAKHLQDHAAETGQKFIPLQGGSVRHEIDLKKLIDAFGKGLFFSETDLVESVSHGMPVLMSLRHESDASKAHMYVVYSVTYTPNSRIENMVGNINPLSPSRGSGYLVKSIDVINPWTGEVEHMEAGDFQPRVAYMMSEASTKAMFNGLSNSFH